jgi:type IV secretion system protein VirB9
MTTRKAMLVLGAFLAAVPLHSEALPRGLTTDARVKVLVYSPNQVYKLVAYYGYEIDVQIGDNEEIKTLAVGDSVAWQIAPAGQHIFIKPMASPARTNLTVVTNRRTYTFDLSARSTPEREAIAFLVRFRYPETESVASLVSSAAGKDASHFNLDYKISGAPGVQPLHVFDDGQFTYFQFDPRRELPAIFVVGGDGKESLINYRMDGGYVIVERLGDFYTLRNGKETATAINQQKLGHDPYAKESDNGKPGL